MHFNIRGLKTMLTIPFFLVNKEFKSYIILYCGYNIESFSLTSDENETFDQPHCNFVCTGIGKCTFSH